MTQSIERDLIRYRIEKRMGGRRDLLLHLLVYAAVIVIVGINSPGLTLEDVVIWGGFWTIPLVLHGLRYYYRSGPGALARADEIESAIDDQLSRTALDDDEELLIEERISKRVLARRLIVAHGLSSAMIVSLLWFRFFFQGMYSIYDAMFMEQVLLIAAGFFALHVVRFFFVHGRTPTGRALKIDGTLERVWLRSRAQSHDGEVVDDEGDILDLGIRQGRSLRLTAEGELDEPIADDNELAQGSSGSSLRRSFDEA